MLRLSIVVLPALLLVGCAGDQPTAPVPTSGTEPALSVTPTVSVLMSGLNAPRGLAWGPDGALYVAEAGTTAINGPCATVARGPNCYSGTGSVSRWRKGRQTRVASRLPSAYNTAFADIIGPQDVAFEDGRALVTIGWGGDPAARAQLGGLARGFGWLIQLKSRNDWRGVADLAGAEADENPAGGPLDSNPFGVLALDHSQYVADAGGNSLLRVSRRGHVSVVGTFPRTPAPVPFGEADAVPTEVQRGPDGALYVSTLSGVPFANGAAKIYRVGSGGTPAVYADGFKTITDFAFGRDGSLYVLEYASGPFLTPPGRVVRVARNGTRTVITAALTNPTGILLDRRGTIYVSNRGDQAGVGEVLRIVP